MILQENSPVKATRSGSMVNFLSPDPATILLDDIAFALSNICRFTGHVEFYSVAQHSLLVSRIVPEQYALDGLMHDASEAYLGDVHSPLKRELTRYVEIEKIMTSAIQSRFCLGPEPAEVKQADLVLLATEHRDLFPPGAQPWALIQRVQCLPDTIVPMSPRDARTAFLARFNQLWQAREGVAHAPPTDRRHTALRR